LEYHRVRQRDEQEDEEEQRQHEEQQEPGAPRPCPLRGLLETHAMKTGPLVLLLTLCGSLGVAAARIGEKKIEGVVFYVAPNGNDAWSGGRPTPNRARSDGPFATLQRARDAIRRLSRRDRPVTVRIRRGTYFLARPLVFTPEDSGTPAAPITFAAYPGEKVVVSGGRRITG
jgi:hypothetical protein